MNKGTPQVCQVAFCPEDGIPLHEAAIADGFAWCAECEKPYSERFGVTTDWILKGTATGEQDQNIQDEIEGFVELRRLEL